MRVRFSVRQSWKFFLGFIYSIGLLLDALDKAEEQYRTNAMAHAERIDRFIEIHEEKIRDAENRYNNDLTEMLSSGEREMRAINDNQDKDEEFLRDVVRAMRQRIKNVTDNAKIEFLGNRFEMEKT